MKKLLLILLCCSISGFAFADDDPTPTATATSTSTPTPTATASATATATGTPVPTPTPLSVLYVEDVDGAKKALNVNANVNPTGDVLLKTFANITYSDLEARLFTIGKIQGDTSNGLFLQFTDTTVGFIQQNDATGYGGNFSGDNLTGNWLWRLPNKSGVLATLSDIPASNIIGETHFDGADPSTASVFGNVASVSGSGGAYSILFATELDDANYGVTIGVGDHNTAWSAYLESTSPGTTAFDIRTKKFNPGVLGVALPSFDNAEPASVTVVIYKNP